MRDFYDQHLLMKFNKSIENVLNKIKIKLIQINDVF